tara:strand:+ start:31 stop:846 length:816 start_codon:yes stop_codon:yes gene_type:complete
MWNKLDVNADIETHEHEERFVFLHNMSLSSYKLEEESHSFTLRASKKVNYSAIDWGIGSSNTKIMVADGMTYYVLCGDTLDELEHYNVPNKDMENSVVNHLYWFDCFALDEDNGNDVNQILVGWKSEKSSTIHILYLSGENSKQYVLPSNVDICLPSELGLFPAEISQNCQKFYSQYIPDGNGMGILMIMSNKSNGYSLFRPNPEDCEWELFSVNVSLRIPTKKINDAFLDTYPLGHCVVNCSKNVYFDSEADEKWDPRPLIGGNIITLFH